MGRGTTRWTAALAVVLHSAATARADPVTWIGGNADDWSSDDAWSADPYSAPAIRVCGSGDPTTVSVNEPTSTQATSVLLCPPNVVVVNSILCVGQRCHRQTPSPPALPADGTVIWVGAEAGDWGDHDGWSADPYAAPKVHICGGEPSTVTVTEPTLTQADVTVCQREHMRVRSTLCIGDDCHYAPPPAPPPALPADGTVIWVGGDTGDWFDDDGWSADPYAAPKVEVCGGEPSTVMVTEPTFTQAPVEICVGHGIVINSRDVRPSPTRRESPCGDGTAVM